MIKDILRRWGIISPVIIFSIAIACVSALISILLMILIEGKIYPFGLIMSIALPIALAAPILYKGAALTLALDKSRDELVKVNEVLEAALYQVKELSGLVPICASCKKIRDDEGYWNMLETYIEKHSRAKFSHSICPECAKKLYPDFEYKDKRVKTAKI